MNTDTGGGRGFTQETINRLKKYGIEYYTSDGHPNISLTNINLKQYIENEFNTNFDSDTTKNIDDAKTTDNLLDFIDKKTAEEDIKKKRGFFGKGVDSNDNEPKEMPKKEKNNKNNKIIVGLAVKPTDKQNSKGYLMNGFEIFTVYNSLPYSNIDNVDDFLKSFFKFIQTKRDENGKIESYDNNEQIDKKNITYIVVDPANYKNKNESNVEKENDEKSKKGIDSNSDSNINNNNNDDDDDDDITIGGKKKTQKKSNKNRKTQKRQKKQKS